jgi:hypothetical protein
LPNSLPAVEKVAHKYGIEELMKWCVEALAAKPTEDNYLELLNLAELYGLRPLKAAALRFIALNVDRLAPKLYSI